MKQAMIALATLTAIPATAAPTSPAASAKAFVESIYRPWVAALKRQRGTMYQPPSDKRVFVPEIATLLTKDQRIANRTNEVGVIDWVILCACQDDEGLGYRVTVPQATANSAIAKVALSFAGGDAETLTLKLVRTPQGWRIADVAQKDLPSLLAMLRRELRGKR